MVGARDAEVTQMFDESDDFPTLALEVTPEVVRTAKNIAEDAIQLVSNPDVASQVNIIRENKTENVFQNFKKVYDYMYSPIFQIYCSSFQT